MDDPTLTDRAHTASLTDQANALLPPLPPFLEEHHISIPLSGAWPSKTLIIRPKPLVPPSFLDSPRVSTSKTRPRRPLIVLFHGGGLTTGSPLMLTLPARLIANRFSATVICPSYRLAPENAWPQAMLDGLEVVRILSERQEYWYGADPAAHGFVVGGIAAGADIAAVVAGCVSWETKTYPMRNALTGVFLAVPMLFVEDIVPKEYKALWVSREQNQNAVPLNTEMVEKILRFRGGEDRESALFSPVNLIAKRLGKELGSNHPPVYLQGCELDPLRDDVVVYERMLAHTGVQTKLSVVAGCGHDALTTHRLLTSSQELNTAVEEGTIEGLQWLLDHKAA